MWEKGYLCDSLFKLKVMTNVSTSWYKLYFFYLYGNLCHERLGHINYDTLWKLISFELLLKFDINSNHKCEVCVESKLTITPF